MAGLLLLLLPSFIASAHGRYMIITPRQYVTEQSAQVCVMVDDAAAPSGELTFAMTGWYSHTEDRRDNFMEPTNFVIPPGHSNDCYELPLAKTQAYAGALHLNGTVGGKKVNHTENVDMRQQDDLVFVQTDKYLYEPGQLVQIRILTIKGPDMRVQTSPYSEVYVQNPSKTRIAQWKNLDNSKGLVHLDFRLADEPEKGLYKVYVKTKQVDGVTKIQEFKVQEFVLPRFEVQVKPPSYVLAIDEAFTITVCANYTFGQPVKGELSLTVSNKRNKKCLSEIMRNISINGCLDVEVTSAEMQFIDCSVFSISVLATVREDGTGVELHARSSVSVTRRAVEFKKVYKDAFMKPNLPYTLKLRAERPDGSPAAGVPMEACAAGRCSNFTSAPDGLITMVLPKYKTNKIYVESLNCRAIMQTSSFSDSIKHYYSPSNSSLLIYAPEDKLECKSGETQKHILPVFFSANNTQTASISVKVVSRGKVQYHHIEEHQLMQGELPISVEDLVEPLPPPLPNTVRGMINIEISLPPTASPTAQVLVWYARADGEVVSDHRELQVEQCLPNTVNFTWSKTRAEPGETASFSLASHPDSLCSLGVVDRSSELLAVDPDPITANKLFEYVENYDIYPYVMNPYSDYTYCRNKAKEAMLSAAGADSSDISPPFLRHNYYSDFVDAFKMFVNAGLFVFTDLTVETRPCEEREYQHHPPFGGGYDSDGIAFTDDIAPQALFLPDPALPQARPPPPAAIASEEKTTPEEAEPNEAPRTNFPETWLWDLIIVPSSGVEEQAVVVPDTITQWVGKAVCVHPEHGVGLSPRRSLITFTPFFLDLTLPPSVKRGETLPVKVSVFNYLDQPLPVRMVVEESEEYEVLAEVGETADQLGQRSTCVLPHDKVVLTVRIKPLTIADVNISVSATVDPQQADLCQVSSADITVTKRDAVIKPITVEAEGFLREKTWTKYICSKDFETGEDELETWDLRLPEVLVEGSERAWVTAVGDLLALSLENLGHLIRMPYGCGEQNMVNFAPNIYILDYLNTTGQTTPEAADKLTRFMRTGYQRELLYKRDDGSYSAFGNADDSGSTWLTAFVLKSFVEAQSHIQIDEQNLEEALNWLHKNNRTENGCFVSVGKLLHKGMQGGVGASDSPVPLTAYVIVALMEAGEDPQSPPVAEALRCLTTDQSTHPYNLALKAYALALAGHPEAPATLQLLLDQAIVSKNAFYWQLPPGSGSSQAAALETAGYAILAMLTQDPQNKTLEARKVVKWMTSQRNGQGGFYSTQDTVVALQAMARYQSIVHQGPLSVAATVTATDFSHTFNVTEDNKLLEQLQTLPTLPTNVSITMTGQGCAVLQAVLRYNIPKAEASDAFDLTVNAITVPDQDCRTKRITACASYRLEDGQSNMVVVEVDLISGYIPMKDDLKQLLKDDRNIKRYEVDGSKVNFYLEELSRQDTCINFRALREVDVEEVKPGTVVVYDYYQPEFKISERYTFPPNDECLSPAV